MAQRAAALLSTLVLVCMGWDLPMQAFEVAVPPTQSGSVRRFLESTAEEVMKVYVTDGPCDEGFRVGTFQEHTRVHCLGAWGRFLGRALRCSALYCCWIDQCGMVHVTGDCQEFGEHVCFGSRVVG